MTAYQLADELENAPVYMSVEGDAARMLRNQSDKIKELQEFAIWMTGCGYDFCQHEYFIKCRDNLLIND